ncbi:MAG: zinc ribbon domain-containing protein [Solirubrobacteraceae bacterium]
MLAIFGISNDGLNLAVNMIILFVVVIYLALVYWTYTDALRRIADPMLVICATVAALLPFIGTILYVIVRPPEYLDDVRERELEIQASEARLADLNYMLCPHCEHEVEKDFLRCPTCLRRLRAPCTSCRRPLDPDWRICPYCEAELSGSEGRARRRATAREP